MGLLNRPPLFNFRGLLHPRLQELAKLVPFTDQLRLRHQRPKCVWFKSPMRSSIFWLPTQTPRSRSRSRSMPLNAVYLTVRFFLFSLHVLPTQRAFHRPQLMRKGSVLRSPPLDFANMPVLNPASHADLYAISLRVQKIPSCCRIGCPLAAPPRRRTAYQWAQKARPPFADRATPDPKVFIPSDRPTI